VSLRAANGSHKAGWPCKLRDAKAASAERAISRILRFIATSKQKHFGNTFIKAYSFTEIRTARRVHKINI